MIRERTNLSTEQQAALTYMSTIDHLKRQLSCFEKLDVSHVAKIFGISEAQAAKGLEHGFLFRQLTVPDLTKENDHV